jgi:hypothetical protein
MYQAVPRLLATVALGSLLVISCSSDDDPAPSGKGGAGGGAGGRGGGGGQASGGSGGGSGGASGSGGALGSGGAAGGTGGGSGGAAGGTGGGTGGADAGGGSEGGSGDVKLDTSGETGGEAGGAASMAVATIAGLGGRNISGKVTFVEVAGGVQATYELENCQAGANLTHIHTGSCGNIGGHWNRGEGIFGNERVTCGADGTVTVMYTRPPTPANVSWTIGGSGMSNLIGRPVVIHLGTSTMPPFQGCGVITAVP